MDWQDLVTPQKLEDMRSAISLTQKWQEDVFRISILENSDGFFQEKERIAMLLVDNQLGKLARKVRLLGAGKEGLASDQFIEDWAEISFLLNLWQRFDSLPEGLKLNLIYQSGPNITKRHLDKFRGFSDVFVVLGRSFQQVEQLLQRTVYVFGLQRKEYFMLLDFSFNRQPFPQNFSVGQVYKGEAVRYPFPGSLRIAVRHWAREKVNLVLLDSIPVPDLDQVARELTDRLKINPFCIPFPTLVELQCDFVNDTWKVINRDGRSVRIVEHDNPQLDIFRATCFRQSGRFMGLVDRNGFIPLSYYNGDQFLDLALLTPKDGGS